MQEERRSPNRPSNKQVVAMVEERSEAVLHKIQSGVGLLTAPETAWVLSQTIEMVYVLRDAGRLKAAQQHLLLFDPKDFPECIRLMKEEVHLKREVVLVFKQRERARAANA